MNQKNIVSDKKNVGRRKKASLIADKCNLYNEMVDLSTKEILSRKEAMLYLSCGKTWLNDQYNKKGGLFLKIPGCVKREIKGGRVFFVRELINQSITTLPNINIG